MLTQAQERKDELGTSPLDMDFKTMRAAMHEYYGILCRGETGMLHFIIAEFGIARHLHDGGSKILL